MAYPTAEIAVMGAEGAVNIISRAAIAKAKDPLRAHAPDQGLRSQIQQPLRLRLKSATSTRSSSGHTRKRLIDSLEMLKNSGI